MTLRPWGVHPSVAHGAAILKNLDATTGPSRERWVALAREAGATDRKSARAFFREQGLGMATGGYLAELAAGEPVETPESYLARCPAYVDAQYEGKRAALRPLLELILEAAYALGADVRACPCQTMVPIYRKRVFAEVKPFASRVDLGLVLGDPALLEDPRLTDTGGFAKRDRITVKLAVATPADVDAGLLTWLRRAYERDV